MPGRRCFFTLLAACCAQAFAWGDAHADGRQGEVDDLEDLRRQIAAIVETHEAPGAAVAFVDRDGRVQTTAAGWANLEGGRPMDAHTLFRVGSFSKSFLCLGIMKLVEEGRLRLEDPVRALVPEIAIENRWEASHPLLVAHLLEHTAGFDEMRFNEIFVPDGREDLPVPALLAINPNSRVARWAPGTRFAYAQPGYTVAAYIIEKVSGLPFERFMEERVFRPLGIDGAAYRITPEVATRLAVGHRRGEREAYKPLVHRPAAGLIISADGVGRLIALMIGRGTLNGVRFLSPESIARIERSGTLPYGPAPADYGLGNWGDVGQPVPMRGHGGWMPGYQGIYRYSADRRFGLVVLLNDSGRFSATAAINQTLMRHLLRKMPIPSPPRAPGAALPLVRYAGHYRLMAPSVEFMRFHSDLHEGLDVTVSGGALLIRWQRHDGTSRLVPVGGHAFRHARDSAASVEFVVGADGTQAVVMGSRLYARASGTWSAVRRNGLEIALLLLVSTAIVPPWLLVLRGRTGRHLLLPPFLAALSLLVTWKCFEAAQQAQSLGSFNRATAAVCVFSYAFALAAHVGLRRALYSATDPRVSKALRAYALTTALAAAVLAGYLGHHGIIGVRTWAW